MQIVRSSYLALGQFSLLFRQSRLYVLSFLVYMY